VGLPNPTVVPADYEMDPRVITNSAYAALAAQGLTNLPTLSIVAEIDDVFSSNRGIYANPNPLLGDRSLWERPASAELLMPDGSAGFRMNAGLRIHGSTSRDPNWTHKHSLRLFFRSTYDGPLKYQLFSDSPADRFKTLVLSAGFNTSWNDLYESEGLQAQFVRDQFCSDLQLAMNHPSSHARYVNLYLNGLYWGLYAVHERTDDDFAATYFGGDNSEYDVVRNTQGFFEVVAGDTNAWFSMMALVNGNLSDNAQYEQIQQYLDVDDFIDYMMVNQWAGNTDWANHNWYAIRKRAPGAGWHFIMWDAEITMRKVNENVTGYNQTGTPTMIHSFLRNNAEYKLKFGDHVQKQFFNGGPLFVDTNNPAVDSANPQHNVPGALYMKRIREVDPTVVLESARWGDTWATSVAGRTNIPFTKADFLAELNWITNTYLVQRSSNVLSQYRTQMLFPGAFGTPPPSFNRPGGDVPRGFNLAMTAPAGIIYYTTNGSDPRVYGSGDVAVDAMVYSGLPLVINNTTQVKARALIGANWSPLTEATFSVAQLLLPLRITEIMYRPVGGDAYQYLELQNLGPTTLDLTGWSISGISFIFPAGFTIAPGAVIVLASALNPAAFAARYPGLNVAAWFSGKLAKYGERIAVLDAQGRTIVAVNYSTTNGWPAGSDGFSIEINDKSGDPDDPANWRLSASINGTPGTVGPVPTQGPVLLNEVMAFGILATTNMESSPGFIELVNTGTNVAILSGWSLSNDGNPRKFIFPLGASITPGGYLVVHCDLLTNTPGLHTGFLLNTNGDHLFLYDSLARRVDGVSFGLQVSTLSIGRVAGYWQLTTQTPGAANQLASAGASSSLIINEWMANSAPGQSDWLELYNPSSLPVALRGLYVGISNSLYQIASLSFVPPGGYAQLVADELPGPNHLDFKLPASGDSIVLYDAFGAEINRVSYGQQSDGISQGRLPDGSANIVNFPGSASPGTTNYVLTFTGPRFNEIMARNDSAVVDPWGRHSDWLELQNPGAAFDLSGMSLSVGQAQPGQFVIPAGTTIGAGSYLTIWCDGSRPVSTNSGPNLNLGQSLDANSGGVYLFNTSGQLVDYVEYGFQIGDKSIGRVGTDWRLLANPTPNAANAPAIALGLSTNLRFNEWMAKPSSGEDWFELYNVDPQPVDLGGLYLTDDPSLFGQTRYRVAPLSFVAGHSWVKWSADGHPGNGRNHVDFQLNGWGESLRLYGTNLALIDAVDFGEQQQDVSQGRLPDGGNTIASFPLSPSPGEGNYLPLQNAAISEVLTHADPPLEDAIELANFSSQPLNIGGWYLSDSQNALQKYRIPAGTTIPANGFKVFYQYQFDPNPGVFPSFALDSAHGDELYLSAADGLGNLTGYRTGVKFGAAQNGVSFGRFTNTTGIEFVALGQRTFGVDNPATLGQFRTGTGLPNAYPKVGPMVINELMYHPVDVSGSSLIENPDEEFVELFNLSTTNVTLFDPLFPANTWRLSGGIDFTFPGGITVSPNGYVVVVHFDPVANPQTLAAFRLRFGLSTNTPIFGPFNGRLSNEGDTVELSRPDAPSGAPYAGFVPLILVDRVSYLPTAPWRTAADGGGASLQRRQPQAFGNDPFNWKAEAPTAGRANVPLAITPPVITLQPQNLTITAGDNANLSVTVAGAFPLAYQWQLGGINLNGATNSTLIILNAQPTNSGSYRVWVTNVAGAIFSQTATLAVLQPPIITTQPLSFTVPEGSNATLTVTAKGTAPLAYQWYFNNSIIPGANSATLILNQVSPSQGGSYQVVVTNSVGLAVSAPAILKVAGVDSDGDGIPDAWMILNFGHPTGQIGDHSRAQDDPDGDGMTNLQEYLAGTNPLDAQSNLKLKAQGIDPATGRPRICFTAVAGIGYTILYSDKVASGVWHKLRDFTADPTTRIVSLDDPETATVPVRFYRVVTPIQPTADGDIDGDGIPDGWMIQNFGHPTGVASDNSRAQDDADGDGMTNLQEYRSGTDPRDVSSCLKLKMLGTDPITGRLRIFFTAVAQVSYTILFSDTVAPSAWHKLRDVPADLATREFLVDDPGAAGVPQRFYRVVTPMLPAASPDTDGDGIPDWWMVLHFGHPTGQIGDHSRAQDDPDGDHMSNLQEYLAGTDPLDDGSSLKLQTLGINNATGLPRFSFTAIAGMGYTIQYSPKVSSGVWYNLREVLPEANTRIVYFEDAGSSNAPTRFYRIATQPLY
jgi:hypothetical protein